MANKTTLDSITFLFYYYLGLLADIGETVEFTPNHLQKALFLEATGAAEPDPTNETAVATFNAAAFEWLRGSKPTLFRLASLGHGVLGVRNRGLMAMTQEHMSRVARLPDNLFIEWLQKWNCLSELTGVNAMTCIDFAQRLKQLTTLTEGL